MEGANFEQGREKTEQEAFEDKLKELDELKVKDPQAYEEEIDMLRGVINHSLPPELWERYTDEYPFSDELIIKIIQRA